jgi:hypothetical protein
LALLVAPLLKLGVGEDGGFNPSYLKRNKMHQEMITQYISSVDLRCTDRSVDLLTPCKVRAAALLSVLQVVLVPLLLVLLQEATPSRPRYW